MSRPHAILRALAATMLALAACKKDQSTLPPPAPPPAGTSSGATALVDPPPETLFPTGVMLRGDRASLQHYLRYVDTVVDAKVNVTYAPATVYVDRDAAIDALHSVSWDGVTWKFDAAEPVIQKLKPGSVLLVWGLAIRKVTQVSRVGDEIVVRTDEAQLTDAVTDADISWDAPGNVSQGAMTVRVPKPADSVTFRGASYRPPPVLPSPFRFASFAPRDTSDEAEPDSAATEPPALYSQSYKIKVNKFSVAMAFGAPSNDQLNFYAQYAYGDEADEPVKLPNELGPIYDHGKDFAKAAKSQDDAREKEAKEGKKKLSDIRDETKMTSGPGPGLRSPIPKTTEEQQKQKEEEDKQAAHDKKYGKPTKYSGTGTPKYPKMPEMPKVPKNFTEGAKSLWEGLKGVTAIKVTAAGTVTGLRSQGDIVIKGGTLQHATLSNPELHLNGDIWWSARIDKAVFAEATHVEVPITFRVPLIIGGLPAFLEIAVNAQIHPAMTSKKATARGHRHFDFTKSAQLTLTNDAVGAASSPPTAEAEKGDEESMLGIGVSGLVIALQIPRVGFGFGIIGSNLMVYFDVVVSSGVTYTGTTGIIQCTRSILDLSYNYGVSATFLGFPLGEKRYNEPIKKWTWDSPEGRTCPAS